jgi:hypothetical protein
MDMFMTNYFLPSQMVISGEFLQEKTAFCSLMEYKEKIVCPVHIKVKTMV